MATKPFWASNKIGRAADAKLIKQLNQHHHGMLHDMPGPGQGLVHRHQYFMAHNLQQQLLSSDLGGILGPHQPSPLTEQLQLSLPHGSMPVRGMAPAHEREQHQGMQSQAIKEHSQPRLPANTDCNESLIEAVSSSSAIQSLVKSLPDPDTASCSRLQDITAGMSLAHVQTVLWFGCRTWLQV